MANDRSSTGLEGTEHNAGDEEFQLGVLASKFGLSLPEARDLMTKYGDDPEALEAKAKELGAR